MLLNFAGEKKSLHLGKMENLPSAVMSVLLTLRPEVQTGEGYFIFMLTKILYISVGK